MKNRRPRHQTKVMQQLTLILMFTGIWCLGFAQAPETITSLKQQLTKSQADTSRVLLLNTISREYRNIRPDSAIFYSNRAIDLANKINFHKGLVIAYSELGSAYAAVGSFPKGLELAFKALQIANQYHIKSPLTYNHLGQTYYSLNDYPNALKYTKEAYKLSIENNDTSGIGYHYFQMNIGTQYEEMNQLDSALYYHQKAYWGFIRMNNPISQIYRHLGNIQLKLGNYSTARKLYQQSLQISLKRGEHRFTSATYIELARLYQNTNQRDSSIFFAQKGLLEAELVSAKRGVIAAASLLSACYEPIDSKTALRYYKLAAVLKDSLYGASNIQAVQSIMAQAEARQKEIEAAKTAYQNRLRQYVLLGGLGMFLLISFILYRNNRQKQKANVVLEKTLSTLKSAQAQLIQSEKLASLGELTAGIAHEIQNPLNFVNNFAEVSAEMLGEMKEEIMAGNTSEVIAIADDLEQNLSKINHHGQRASAIVKGMLEHSRTSTGVKEPTDLNALADEYLRLAYHGLRAKDNNFNATLETHFDPDLPLVSVIPQDIGRVLLNLINNAFYAVAERSRSTVTEKAKQGIEGYQPTVTISSQKLEDAIEIRVQDNGNGIPEAIREKIFQPFFTTKPTGQGTGLGLSLAYDIVVKGHSGSLEVLSTEREGTEFIIQFPAKNNG